MAYGRWLGSNVSCDEYPEPRHPDEVCFCGKTDAFDVKDARVISDCLHLDTQRRAAASQAHPQSYWIEMKSAVVGAVDGRLQSHSRVGALSASPAERRYFADFVQQGAERR